MGAFLLVAATMLGSNACAKDTASTDDGQTASTAETTTASESSETDGTGSTQGETDTQANDTQDTSLSFYAGPDADLVQGECDSFAQDCPDGEKCVPYASTGGSWDANKCVPVTGNGSAGDPCTYGGLIEATDDCDAQTMCWNVMDVDGMPVGVCTEFCMGMPDDPLCPDATTCVIANEGSINLCLQTCDPLMQACGPGLGCYWFETDFVCLDAGPGNPDGQPCDVANSCMPGSICMPAQALPSCDDIACCTSFCDTLNLDACPDPELECVTLFDLGMAPAGYETLGACLQPAP